LNQNPIFEMGSSKLWCDPKITGFQYNVLLQYNSFNKKGT
jgi:hypothetical protein